MKWEFREIGPEFRCDREMKARKWKGFNEIRLRFSSLYQTTWLPAHTYVRMYLDLYLLRRNDECVLLYACAVWIWMKVSVLIKLWIICIDSHHSLTIWVCLKICCFTRLSVAISGSPCSGNEAPLASGAVARLQSWWVAQTVTLLPYPFLRWPSLCLPDSHGLLHCLCVLFIIWESNFVRTRLCSLPS